MQPQFKEFIPQNLLDQEEHQLYDFTSERGVLACIKRWPMLIYEAERQIKDSYFNLPANRAVYLLMLHISKLAQTHNWQLTFERPAMLQTAHYMGSHWSKYFLETTEGMEQMRWIEVMEPMITLEGYQQYAHVVIDRAQRVAAFRQARQVMLQVGNVAQKTAKQVLISAESAFCSLAAHNETASERQIVKMGHAAAGFYDKALLNRSFHSAGLFNLACPLFPFWMEIMNGGFKRRGMTIVAARPKVGKSTLLLYIAVIMAVHFGVPVLYLDGEMSREEMFSRELSMLSSINEHKLLRGRFMDDSTGTEHNTVLHSLQTAYNAPLYYCNTAGADENFITSMMRQFRNNIVGTQTMTAPHNGQQYNFSNPCLVIYDWLKLPDADSLQKAAEFQQLGYLASAIKNQAAALDLPVIAGAQNNRGAIGKEGEDWEEMAEAFVGGSDRLAQFCTMLCILRNLDYREQDLVGTAWQTRPDRKGANALWFNQMMHIPLQRAGGDFRLGIPLHLDRGLARYTECMGTQADEQDRMQEWLKGNFRKKKRRAVSVQPREIPANRTLQNVASQTAASTTGEAGRTV